MVFDDKISTVLFIREVKIPPNWTDILQIISQSDAPENIYISHTCFITYLEEDPRETPSHETRVAPENNNKIITLLQSKPYLK